MDTGQKESILIVEDEGKIAEIVRAYLEKEGFRVKVADTAEQALGLFKEMFDLIILDLMLPDMQGEELCKVIREGSDVPVIMLTAKSGEEERIRGLGIGADDYVVKPFSPRELVARVKAQLRRSGRVKKKLLSYNGGGIEDRSHQPGGLQGGRSHRADPHGVQDSDVPCGPARPCLFAGAACDDRAGI